MATGMWNHSIRVNIYIYIHFLFRMSYSDIYALSWRVASIVLCVCFLFEMSSICGSVFD